jgi:hypothetical protein
MMRTALLTVVLAIITANSALAQIVPTRFGEGTHAFRAVLAEVGLKPLKAPALLDADSQNRIVVILGDPNILDSLCRDDTLPRFIKNGGAVLIATDRATPPSARTALGFHVAGRIVGANPDECWHENPACPFVRELRTPNRARHQVFQQLSGPLRLATNNPSYLTKWFPDIIASLPGDPVPSNRWNGLQQVQTFAQPVFACARDLGRGRLIVLADHSIFINDMMLQPDNDNIPFAFNAGRWLMDAGDGRRRTEVAFYEDGQLQADFNVSLDYPRIESPPLEAFVPVANELLVGLERENAFNKMLLDATGGPFPIFRSVAIFLTMCLLTLFLFRFLNSRYRPESRPRMPAAKALATPAIPTTELRHQAVLAQGNLAEAARELAIQAFVTVGLRPTANTLPPMVKVTGSWLPFRTWRWNREVRDWWNLAVNGPVHRVSPAALQKLDESLRDLLAAIAADTVRLASADSAI